jgi:hypothetical protein
LDAARSRTASRFVDARPGDYPIVDRRGALSITREVIVAVIQRG